MLVKTLNYFSYILIICLISACTIGQEPDAYNLNDASTNLPPLTIEPTKVQVVQGQNRRFSGQGGYIGTVGYRYSVTTLDGNSDPGTIDPITGVYTAPASVNANNALSFIVVTDARGVTASTSVYNVSPLEVTPSSQVVTVGKKANFDVIGGSAPYTWCVIDTVTSLCLPNVNVGNITSTGMFEASLVTVGNTVVKVTDASGNTAEAAISIQPIPQLFPSGESFPYGWTLQMITTGGSPPYRYEIDATSAASGGAIDSNGLLTVPSITGITTITVTDNYTYSVSASIYVINPNKVASGPNSSCALFPDTKGIKCWGDNTFFHTGYPTSFVADGLIGTNNYLGDEPNEVGSRVGLHQILNGTYLNSEQITMGLNYSCALDSAFNIRCWGTNSHGQFGRTTPALGGTIQNASASSGGPGTSQYTSGSTISANKISAGGYHLCALDRTTTTDQRVYCWGKNTSGQLAIGSVTDQARPNSSTHQINFPSKVLDIQSGENHTCVLLKGTPTFNSNVNQIRCWGDNSLGQLGITNSYLTSIGNLNNLMGDQASEITALIGTTGSSAVTFTNPGTGLPVGQTLMPTAISTGKNHTCAILNDLTVRCWGNNSHGQLGRGTNISFYEIPENTGINLNNVRPLKLISGFNKTCVILLGGILKCFGENNSGSLGVGSCLVSAVGTSPSHMGPNLISTIVHPTGYVVDATIGESHVCGLMNDNRIKCWGRGLYGQLGNNSTSTLGCDIADMGELLPTVGFF